MSTQRRRHATLMKQAFVRCLRLVVVLVMVGHGTAAWALAGLAEDSCCAGDYDSPDGGDSDDEGDCPCPLDCSKGCVGLKMPLVLDPPFNPLPAGTDSEVLSHSPHQSPGETEPIEILHVPKR